MAWVRLRYRRWVVDTTTDDLWKWREDLSASRCLELGALKLESWRKECAGCAGGGWCEDLAESRWAESGGGHVGGCGGGEGGCSMRLES